MPDASTYYNEIEDAPQCADICPICARKVVEDEMAVQCDGKCKRWHHITCAELQQGQYNALRATSKRKSKLLWLCISCEQDFVLYKASKNVQEEMELLRLDMNKKLDDLSKIIDRIKFGISQENTRETIITQHQGQENNNLVYKDVVTRQVTNKTQRSDKNKKQAPEPPELEEKTAELELNLQCEQQERVFPFPTIMRNDFPEESTTQTRTFREILERETPNEKGWNVVTKRRKKPENTLPTSSTNSLLVEDNNDNVYKQRGLEHVKRRIRSRYRALVGTNNSSDSLLQAGERFAWLYVGRLSEHSTTAKVHTYLEKKGFSGKITCEELKTQGTNKAFKVGFPLHYLEVTEDPNFWPTGIIVRPFRRPYRYPQAANLDS